jgi:hypothetical protein
MARLVRAIFVCGRDFLHCTKCGFALFSNRGQAHGAGVDGEARCAVVVKNEKRSGMDRRATDAGPPNGWRERRKTVERRRVEVDEIPFSEWLAHRPIHDPTESQK